MANCDYDIGVIGGGAAGLTVASAAAPGGAKTVLVEKEQELGRDCLHFGWLPSKTRIKSAHIYHDPMILNEKEASVGAQVPGPRAGNLIAKWVTVLNGKTKSSTLALAAQPDPIIGEINKRVAGSFFAPKIFSPAVKKGLKLFSISRAGHAPRKCAKPAKVMLPIKTSTG